MKKCSHLYCELNVAYYILFVNKHKIIVKIYLFIFWKDPITRSGPAKVRGVLTAMNTFFCC